MTFRLNRSSLLLVVIGAAFSGQAHAAAGRVEFAIGGATVQGPGGQQRPVTRGAEVNSGDVVRTTNGRVQVRMADGAYISLQPNTEFGIKDYRFDGKTDGTEGAFYSLLKGAMRTVTGLIGRVNRDRYQVATPTATVGIRGTGGLIQIQNDGSTLVQGTSGIWFLANPAGSINVPAGVSGLAPSDPKQPPKETEGPPTAGPAPLPPEDGYVQGNQTEDDGTAVITGNVLLSGSGYFGQFAYGTSDLTAVADQMNGNAVFNAAGQLTEFSDGRANVYKLVNGSHADFGTDGLVAWGRWIGEVSNSGFGTEIYKPEQGFHYVVGTPTATMPTTGTATYTLLGATRPTYVDGSTSPGSFAGSMDVDFGRSILTANFTVTMPDRKYDMTGSTSVSSTFQLSSPAVTGCATSCSGYIQGFFAGTNAERAGVGYNIYDQKEVVGAAAFTRR
ncbi:MAG: FecR family protein [Betaproteobacteria bacterium]|nr:FecR family protein [Betaproteobacteria bacterium]MDH5221506.1 FecR family protein [Betaproteobacteria bacterium]MDH5352532.1 FecR family protein [Betaproteobacteria bacterium]